MMAEMRNLSKQDKPKLGEVVNKAKSNVEAAIEAAKDVGLARDLQKKIMEGDLGNTIQIPGIPGFGSGPGKRHPINLVMDLACQIFEEIGYEVITGPESSPEIENDFFNFEALGMPQVGYLAIPNDHITDYHKLTNITLKIFIFNK